METQLKNHTNLFQTSYSVEGRNLTVLVTYTGADVEKKLVKPRKRSDGTKLTHVTVPHGATHEFFMAGRAGAVEVLQRHVDSLTDDLYFDWFVSDQVDAQV